MHSVPHHDFRDVLAAPARAMSAKQVFVMTLFLCLGLLVWDLFTYLAYAVDGQRLGVVFGVYGMFPFESPALVHTFAWIVYGAGGVLSVIAVMLGIFAVAAINIERLRGNRFLSAGAAIRFAFSRFRQIFLSELAVVLFIAFVVLLLAAFGLVSRIPFIGDWLYTVFFALPNFVIGLFAVFIIFVFTLTVLLLPAVAAAERHGEAFASILETFSTIIRQPFRWLGYTAYSIVAAKVCSFIYAYFCFRAVQFLVGATMIGGGERINELVKAGLSHLPVNSEFTREVFTIFPGVDFSFTLANWSRSASTEAVGYVMAVMIFLIFASVIGYAMSIIAAAQAHGFAAIRCIKDDYCIADEKPLFFEEEHVNPEIETEDIE